MSTLLANGGTVLWLLAALSVISIGGIVYVWSNLAAAKLKMTASRQAACLSGASGAGPYARIVATSRDLQRKGASPSGHSQELAAFASKELHELRNGMRLLELIASAAPLIGLLGTVIGMIEAFKQLETAGSQVDPSMLSGGIWQALLTTAAGLVVALPALTAWHMFDRKIETARINVNTLLASLTSGGGA